MNNMNIDNATTTTDFDMLCTELGERLSTVKNASTCLKAFRLYEKMYPDTKRGKGKKKDRDTSIPSFRQAAAEKSGVSASTIDALLQVGKALQGLAPEMIDQLAASSLGNWTRALRKLATRDFEKERATIITEFITEEKTDPKSAREKLETKLGLNEKSQQQETVGSEQGNDKADEPQQAPQNDSFDMPLGPFSVQIVVKNGTKEDVRKFLIDLLAASPSPAEESEVEIGAAA